MEGARIQVKVQAGARKDAVEMLSENRYYIQTKARAKEGKANERVRELLGAALNVSPDRLRLVRGATAPHKSYLLL